MAETLPPNTYDLDVRVRVTLPDGETSEQQDITLLLTGEDWDPWPGVKIHDMDLLAHRPAGEETQLAPIKPEPGFVRNPDPSAPPWEREKWPK